MALGITHILAIKWLFKKWPRYSGFIFTGLSLLKMTVSVLFLIPYILSTTINTIPIALNFMLIYLILLAVEVIFIAKSMGKNHQN